MADEIRNLAKYMHGIKVLPIYGGQEIVKQIRSLKSGTQIIIGTPGRVMDHMRRKTIKMDQVHTVVLDEADEMLNMGFREDIETILSGVPEEKTDSFVLSDNAKSNYGDYKKIPKECPSGESDQKKSSQFRISSSFTMK